MNAWETRKLGEVLKLEYGKPLPEKSRDGGGEYPAYGANGVKCWSNQYYFDKQSIIVGRKGSAGEVNITDGKFWPLDVTYFVTYDSTQYDLTFLYHCLRHLRLTKLAKGVKPGINRNDVYQIEFAFPPLPEQKRIVSIVDQAFEGIDRAIANTKKNLTNARELFESYLNTVFTQRDSVPTVAIGDIGEVFDGPHATPKTIDSGPIFLGISSLQDGSIKLEKTRHVSPEDFQRWTRRVKPRTDDIVFSYETRLGQAAIIPEGLECCLGRRMGLVRVDKTQIEPLYFLYLYLSMPFQKFLNKKTVRGATVDRISIKEVPSFSIPLPDLEEQKSIVSKVDALSVEIQRLEAIYRQKLAALIELKQSVLQKAFTGELTADIVNQTIKNAEEAIAA